MYNRYEQLDMLLTKISNDIDCKRYNNLRYNLIDYKELFISLIEEIRLEFKDDELDVVQEWIDIAVTFIDMYYYQIIVPLDKSIQESQNDKGMHGLYSALKYELQLGSIMMIVDDIPSKIAISQVILRYVQQVCGVFDLSFNIDLSHITKIPFDVSNIYLPVISSNMEYIE